MPVRQRNIRRRQTLKVADLDLGDLADFVCGRGPGWPGHQWQTEEEYLDAYEQIRSELLADEAARGFRPPYAEELWQKRRGNR